MCVRLGEGWRRTTRNGNRSQMRLLLLLLLSLVFEQKVAVFIELSS